MKVLIADDEVHICSLIQYLIAWDELGLTPGGMFSCGEEVLEYLRGDTADILICDIEMPGMNGIELMQTLSRTRPEMKIVVVSGFRNFDYARSAMQYGACNYLLKPIDEKELNGVLREIVTSAQAGVRQDSVMMRASGRLQLLELLRAPGAPEDLAVINKNYDYHFSEGTFQVLRAVCLDGEPASDTLRLIQRMFEEILRPRLADFCREFEFYRESAVHLCILINREHTGMSEAQLQSVLDSSLRGAIVELGCKTQSRVSIGVGPAVGRFSEVHQSYLAAAGAVCERLYRRESGVLYAEALVREADRIELLTAADRQALARCIEQIDPDGACRQIRQVFRHCEHAFRARPQRVFECARAVLTLTEQTMEHVGVVEESRERLVQSALLKLECCADVPELEACLCGAVCERINGRLAEKLANVSAYAQQAKQYIDKHYMQNITLELLAGQLNINPTYLSVVFKNEIRMNYSKYLTMVRMEKAKELLRRCDLNLTQVAHAVGYDRTAYFSNVFRQYVGVKPTEYRRLHQHGIGD